MVTFSVIARAMDVSESSVSRWASEEGWRYSEKTGRGGRTRVFAARDLPSHIQEALLTKAAASPQLELPGLPAVQAAAQPPALPAPAPTLADWQRRAFEARAAILAEVDRLAGLGGPEKAIRLLERQAKAGELRPDLAELVRLANAKGGSTGNRTLSRRTLYRWLDERKAGRLAPKDVARPRAETGWELPLLQLYRRPTKPGLADALRELPKILPEGVPAPSYDQARRYLRSLAPFEREKGRRGPNALLALKGFKRRSTEGLLPLDVVTADGHSFKSKVQHPMHGRPFKPEVCALQDVTTRFVVGWSAGLAESTWTVMDAYRHGVEQHGQFAMVYTDNGSGFVADCLTAEVVGVLARLGARHITAMPGRAQARGKIERLGKSLWIPAAKNLPTYVGHDMDREAARKVVKLVTKQTRQAGTAEVVMSWPDFLAYCQQTVDDYNNRPHRSLPKIRDAVTGKQRHMSPAERLQQFRDQGWAPLTLPPAVVEDCFRPYEVRTTSRGEVVLPWGRYFDQALVAWHGERVRVGYDIHDGSRAWVRSDLDGRLICIARRDANVIPEQPANKVEQARAQRAKRRADLLQQHLEEVEAEHRGVAVIEHMPAETLDMPTLERVDRRFAELEAAAAPAPAPVAAAPAPALEDRPHFTSDVEWARWVMANPDAATAADRTLLNRRLTSMSFRLLLGIDDTDSGAAAG